MKVRKSPIKLYASPKAVIAQFLKLPGETRVNNIIQRIKNLDDNEAKTLLEKVLKEFAHRHHNIT